VDERGPANLHKIAVNTRFLILPWIIPHLASYLLGLVAKRVSRERHPIVRLETLSERGLREQPTESAWGLPQTGHTGKPNRSLKHVFGYPLK